jgi:diguanylate cyclase (GGDEF)-like protein
MITNSLSGENVDSTCIEIRSFQIRLLKVIIGLAIAGIALVGWVSHVSILDRPINRIAYPSLMGLQLASILILCYWQKGYNIAASGSVGSIATYYVIYLQAAIYGYEPFENNHYIDVFAQCFSLVYIIIFIFLRRHQAIVASILIYTSLLLPFLLKLAFGLDIASNDNILPVLIQMVFSHPIYIAALLWISFMQKSLIKARVQVDSLKIIANFDYLTGIANRRAINDIFQQSLTKAQDTNTKVVVILLDIDHFKQINDKYGHQTGDRVLIEISNVLKNGISSKCSLGRWGGEEFLIVMNEVTLEDGVNLAKSLCRCISQHSDLPIDKVTASFGIAISQSCDTIESLTKRADIALYQAKRKGRDRVEVSV